MPSFNFVWRRLSPVIFGGRVLGVEFFRPLLLLSLLVACAAPPTPGLATQAPAPSPTPRCPPSAPVCPATRLSIAAPTAGVKAFSRLELGIVTDGAWANPFDPDQVDLQVRFTAPDGKVFQVPAFWYQDFDPATLTPKDKGGWRARFTPTQSGNWQAHALLAQGQLASPAVTISVAADPNASGFVQINPANPHYFGFHDGSTFMPIGLNLAWADSLTQTVPEYNRWLTSLSQNGGNLARVWMSSWSMGIEWSDTGLGDYAKRQEQAWLLDQVFDMAEQRNVYILLSLLNHGAFSTSTDPEWSKNPYNLANSGVISNPTTFVTDPAAISYFQRRVRYIAARWGYSTHLFAWEWWNEVNWTGIPDETLQPWTVAMTRYLQQFDPYGHLVTTSFSEGRRSPLWKLPELSFMQQHDYTNNDPILEFADALAAFRRLSKDKPLLVGEHGLNPTGEPPNVELAAAIVHFHNGLWAGPFSGLAGPALAWYWNDFVEPNGLWPQYKALATFFAGENLALMKTAPATVVSSKDAVARSLQSATRALVWLRSQQYEASRAVLAYEKAVGPGPALPNWTFEPPLENGLTLTVRSLADGAYTAHWFDPQTGQWLAPATAQSAGGSLALPAPDFSRDLALRLVQN